MDIPETLTGVVQYVLWVDIAFSEGVWELYHFRKLPSSRAGYRPALVGELVTPFLLWPKDYTLVSMRHLPALGCVWEMELWSSKSLLPIEFRSQIQEAKLKTFRMENKEFMTLQAWVRGKNQLAYTNGLRMPNLKQWGLYMLQLIHENRSAFGNRIPTDAWLHVSSLRSLNPNLLYTNLLTDTSIYLTSPLGCYRCFWDWFRAIPHSSFVCCAE